MATNTVRLHRVLRATPERLYRAFLDADAELDRRGGDGLSLWLDSETIEALTADGTGSASFQHGPAMAKLSVETDQPQHVSVAALA